MGAIAAPGSVAGITRGTDEPIIARAAVRFELTGGRAAVAVRGVAVVAVFVDGEVTVAALGRDDVEDLIADYREQHDAPVLWVTHGSEQARRVANRHFRVTPSGLVEEPLA